MKTLLPLGLLFATTAWAQLDRATLTGIVTDPSGAVVPTVKITATNAETGVNHATLTNESGNYTLVRSQLARKRSFSGARASSARSATGSR